MSSASLKVRFEDGTILHGEYHGTVDLAVPTLWENFEDMSKHFKRQPERKCTCGNDEPVVIATCYAGFSWDARACKKCLVITDGTDPHGDGDLDAWGAGELIDRNMKDGLPEWWKTGEGD